VERDALLLRGDFLKQAVTQLKEFLRRDVAVFPDNIQTFTHVIAEGDMVAAWATCQQKR